MRMSLYSLAVVAFAVAAPAIAQSPFDGTWKGELSSMQIVAKPDRFTIRDGVYDCATCLPPYKTKADGAFHAVAGRPYWDESAITLVDDRTVHVEYRKAGKVIAKTDLTVSADGNTLTGKSSNTNNAAGTLVEATTVQQREGAAVAGAHAVSGSWKAAPAQSVSDAGMQLTLKVDAKTYTQTSPMGETLTATFGGPYAPNVGDPGKTLTRAERVSATRIRLTDMRGGKIVGITTLTAAPDGRTLTGEWADPRDGSKGGWKATKQ